MDHSVGRVPDALHLHLTSTMRTDQRVPARALLKPLQVGQPGDDLQQLLRSPRQNELPVKGIDGSLLMRHEHATRALVQLMQICDPFD
jgi:hypothetical protein